MCKCSEASTKFSQPIFCDESWQHTVNLSIGYNSIDLGLPKIRWQTLISFETWSEYYWKSAQFWFQFVLESAENSPGFLMHALTMLCNSRDLIESQLGQRVVDIAVADFSRISKTTSFNEIPGDVVLRLFDRSLLRSWNAIIFQKPPYVCFPRPLCRHHRSESLWAALLWVGMGEGQRITWQEGQAPEPLLSERKHCLDNVFRASPGDGNYSMLFRLFSKSFF